MITALDRHLDESKFAKATTTWSSYSSLKGRPKPDKQACTQSFGISCLKCLPLVEKDAQELFLSSLWVADRKTWRRLEPHLDHILNLFWTAFVWRQICIFAQWFYLAIKTRESQMTTCCLKYNEWGKQNKWYDKEHCSRYLSRKQRQKVHQPQRPQNGCEQFEDSVRRGVGDCKGHRTQERQSLDDYDEANEDEQRHHSFRMPFQGGITSTHNRQYPENFLAANKSRLPLQLNFSNRRERECHCNRFRCPIHH